MFLSGFPPNTSFSPGSVPCLPAWLFPAPQTTRLPWPPTRFLNDWPQETSSLAWTARCFSRRENPKPKPKPNAAQIIFSPAFLKSQNWTLKSKGTAGDIIICSDLQVCCTRPGVNAVDQLLVRGALCCVFLLRVSVACFCCVFLQVFVPTLQSGSWLEREIPL